MKLLLYSLKTLFFSFRSTLLTLLLMAFTNFMLLSMMTLRQSDTNVTGKFRNLDDVVFLSFAHPGYSKDDLCQYAKNLKAYHKIDANVAEIDGQMYASLFYDDYIMRHFNLEFSEGNIAESDDQVVVTASGGSNHRVGDWVEIKYYTVSGEVRFAQKQICGILDDDNVIYPSFTGSEIDASSMVVNLNNPNRFLIGNDDGLAFLTSDPNFMNPMEDDHTVLFLEPQSVQDSAVADLCESVSLFGTVTTGKSVFEAAHQLEQENVKTYRVLAVSLVLLSVIAVLGHYFINIYRRKSEFAVMYISGCTQKNLIKIEMLQMALVVLASTLLGAACAKIFVEETYYLSLSGTGILASVFLAAAYFLCSVAAVFLTAKKENIANLLRGE